MLVFVVLSFSFSVMLVVSMLVMSVVVSVLSLGLRAGAAA